jgi:dTDP-4-dehydrorhamnose reductase
MESTFMIKSVLVTGKNGQLGKSLQKIVNNCHCERSESISHIQYDFTFVGRDELDLTQPQNIANYFQDKHFDAIINCAAYTAVDKAESEPELADQINHLAVKQLAEIAKQQNTMLIHISTDYVFDGTNHKPYVETDKTNPINVYGLSKLKGEQAIQAVNPKGAIIRTSWVYSEVGNNFVKTMLRLGQERDNLNVIYDQIGTTTYATDLANAIMTLLRHSGDSPRHSGAGRNLTNAQMLKQVQHDEAVEIYHYSNQGICSWYDFAQAIFEIADINCQVYPIETKDYPTPAKRPHFSVMNKAKIKQIPGQVVPYWKQSLKNCLERLF